MLILPRDTWDLFSVPQSGTLSKWSARFLGSSPLIYCNMKWCDFRKKLRGSAEDKLVRVALGHEVIHYLQVMALVPIQAFYWAWLFCFNELHRILTWNEGEELCIGADTLGILSIPPSPLMDDISVTIGNTKFNYELLLEGLALVEQLRMPALPSKKTLEAFVDGAFGDADKQRKNITYVRGFKSIDMVMWLIKREGFAPKPKDVIALMNYFPILFVSDYRNLLETFFSVEGETTNNQRMIICREILKKGLKGFMSVVQNPRLLHIARKHIPYIHKRIFCLLDREATAFIKTAHSNSPDNNYIAETAALTAGLLVLSFEHLTCRPKDKQARDAAEDWAQQGGCSVPCVFQDGTIVHILLKERKEHYRSFATETWLRFIVVKELVRWIVEGGRLVCPFYSYFMANYRKDGLKTLKDFCNRFFPESGRAGSFTPCKLHCSLNASVLDIGKMSDKESELCYFWRAVVASFKKFKRVRRVS
jgi:hypothetical protein